ncbi:MAG: transposase [Lacrimispora sphenoides]
MICFIARWSFDKAFKIAEVKLVLEEGMPVSEVSKELSIYYNSLYRWIPIRSMDGVRVLNSLRTL